MKYVVAGGTHTRIEKGEAVVYKTSDTIELTQKEVAAFPGKFMPLAVPQPQIDEEREAESRAEVAKLQGQVTTLTTERDEARETAEELEKELGETDVARKDAMNENTRLMAENGNLRTQLEATSTPVSEPELKVNPAEGEKGAEPSAVEAVNDGDKSPVQTGTSKKK